MSSTIEESGQIQNECPYCGSTKSYYDEYALKPDAELPPKPWYGIDPYSDPEYLGVWVCSSCHRYLR